MWEEEQLCSNVTSFSDGERMNEAPSLLSAVRCRVRAVKDAATMRHRDERFLSVFGEGSAFTDQEVNWFSTLCVCRNWSRRRQQVIDFYTQKPQNDAADQSINDN